MEMFCYQCEQTAKGTGCGPGRLRQRPETAALQDLLVYATKGMSMYAHRAAELGARGPGRSIASCSKPLRHGDERRLRPRAASKSILSRRPPIRDRAKALYEDACAKAGKTPESLRPRRLAAGRRSAGLVRQGEDCRIPKRQERWATTSSDSRS